MSKATASRLVSLRNINVLLIALLLIAGLLHLETAYGAQLPDRSIEISSSTAGSVASYTTKFTIPQSETLGSVRIEFCSESPLIGQPCTLPPGMSIGAISLNSQSGGAGMSILSSSGTTILLTRVPGTIGPVTFSFTFDNVTNPSATGSFFGRIQTYASTDGSGPNNDFGGIAMDINDSLQISTTVPPYLYFCVGISVTGVDCSTVSGNYIDFGTFSPASTSIAQTQMVASTNADNGYTILVSGTTLTSGNNIIQNLATPDLSRPGVSQFGINLVANSDPQVGQAPFGIGTGQPANGYKTANAYKFVNGDIVATATQPDNPRRYTTSYITNISKTQAPGIYVTTLTYVATGGF